MLPVIVVHGGAGAYSTGSQASLPKYRKGVCGAARAGYAILESSKSAVDAVQTAVECLEDDPTFNAGQGSYLTSDYQIEMDAIIMDGMSHRVGAVGCITNVKNPIKAARLIMDKSDHTLFVGDGALKFAVAHGIKRVHLDELITKKSVDKLKENPKWNPSLHSEIYEQSSSVLEHDTVGAVAVDQEGNVAVATSTGGITAKMPGRMGDSAIVGGGAYADNAVGAVSTTGHGESLMKTCVARHATFLMEAGLDPEEALRKSLEHMRRKTSGVGGAIAVDVRGHVGVSFNAEGMSWATVQNGRLTHGIFADECLDEQP